VLSDKYIPLRAEDRSKIIHEGSGQQVKEGLVEIIFDNTDRRMPIEKNEVSVKRTFNLKDDK